MVLYSKQHPLKSQQDIANHFGALWDVSVKRRTVGDVLAHGEKWLNEDLSGTTKRLRLAKHNMMEEALFLWFSGVRAKSLPVTEEILRNKAKFFGQEMNIGEFQYSNGWMRNFKKRFSICCRALSGESAGIDEGTIREGRARAKTAVGNYRLCDVYNMDETGLFYRMLPDRTLTTDSSVKGTKKAKTRITLALTANADGSDKLKPMVIGNAQKPRCFKHFNASLHCDYYSNKKAWMTAVLFGEWITKFDARMRKE